MGLYYYGRGTEDGVHWELKLEVPGPQRRNVPDLEGGLHWKEVCMYVHKYIWYGVRTNAFYSTE